MDSAFRRVTSADITDLQVNRQSCFVLDFDGLKTARQLVYNRQKKFPGCVIDTSKSYAAANSDGLFILVMMRKAFGRGIDGKWEPGTPKDVIENQDCLC